MIAQNEGILSYLQRSKRYFLIDERRRTAAARLDIHQAVRRAFGGGAVFLRAKGTTVFAMTALTINFVVVVLAGPRCRIPTGRGFLDRRGIQFIVAASVPIGNDITMFGRLLSGGKVVW